MLDLQELKQRAQLAAVYNHAGVGSMGTLTLSWSEVIEIIEELENLEAEKNAAEDELAAEQVHADDVRDELQTEVDDLRHKLAQLEATSKCRECGGALHSVCDDCWHTSGR